MKIDIPNPLAQEEMDAVLQERRTRQLNRLLLVVDVLYALMIYKLFTLMPSPDAEQITRENLVEVLRQNGMRYAMMAVGLVMLLIYWGQNNTVSGSLKLTSGAHASVTIVQTFFLMIYLYFMRLDIEIAPDPIILQLESLFLALAGFGAVLAWRIAYKHGLTSEHVDDAEFRKVRLQLIGEPIAANLTIPLALISPMAWTIGFMVLLFLVNRFMKRRDKVTTAAAK